MEQNVINPLMHHRKQNKIKNLENTVLTIEAERVVNMNKEILKKFSMCFFFVMLFGALGFLVASIVNVAKVYIEISVVEVYYTWVETQIFAPKYFPYYALTGGLFACVGLILIYMWSRTEYI